MKKNQTQFSFVEILYLESGKEQVNRFYATCLFLYLLRIFFTNRNSCENVVSVSRLHELKLTENYHCFGYISFNFCINHTPRCIFQSKHADFISNSCNPLSQNFCIYSDEYLSCSLYSFFSYGYNSCQNVLFSNCYLATQWPTFVILLTQQSH